MVRLNEIFDFELCNGLTSFRVEGEGGMFVLGFAQRLFSPRCKGSVLVKPEVCAGTRWGARRVAHGSGNGRGLAEGTGTPMYAWRHRGHHPCQGQGMREAGDYCT